MEKYGKTEVIKWYWQTWNEPNIGYWRGSRDEFFKLHDHAIKAVRRAIPGAKVGGKKLSVLVWHYHDDDVPGPDAAISLKIPGLPIASGKAKVTHYRVDETHGNSFTLWKSMGEPQKPTPEQYAELEAAGQLATLGPDSETPIVDHTASLDFRLPRQRVSLLVLEWE